MDFGLITTAASGLGTAVDLLRGSLALRDALKTAPELQQLQAAVLDAQQALMLHNAQLLALQAEHFETRQKLRVAEERLAEKGRYTLVEVSAGQWAYRSNIVPEPGAGADPGQPQKPHYLCQPCFDNGRKAVLLFGDSLGFPQLRCPVCKTATSADRARP